MRLQKEAIILGIRNEKLIQAFLSYSVRIFGEAKLNDIIEKVNSSNAIAKFIKEAKMLKVQPGSDDFLTCIHSSICFTLAKAETIAIATVMILMKWNHEIGIPQLITDDIYLNKRFFAILEKCEGYKVHLSNRLNFFEGFYTTFETVVQKNIIESFEPEIKMDIFFDDVMCNAINRSEKSEFRVNNNLKHINFMADDWKLENYEAERGAILYNSRLNENLTVFFPYKLGSTVTVYNTLQPEKPFKKIKIKSGWLERIRQVDQDSTQREGFGAYKEAIDKILEKDPSLDAELCLFIESWIALYGSSSLANNEWLWAFEFEKLVIKSTATTAGLSDEAIRALLDFEL